MSLNYGRVCPNIENPMAEVRVNPFTDGAQFNCNFRVGG